jgi:hypothetical protein
MAYGITVSNLSGVSLIDETSKQIQVLKEGGLMPGEFDYGHPYATWSTNQACEAVIMPRPFEECLLFIQAETYLPNYDTTNVNSLNFCVFKGEATLAITKKSGGSSGQNYFYADLSSYGADYDAPGNNASYFGVGAIDSIKGDSYADVGIGTSIPAWASYVSGSTAPKVIGLEDGGTYDVKITLDQTLNATIPTNTAWTIDKDLAIFAHRYGDNPQYGWRLGYKIGQVTGQNDETGTHGWEVYDTSGNVAWGSNRKNFQIESIVVGDPDFEMTGGAASSGIAAGLPIIHTEVGNANNYTDYYALVTSFGNSTIVNKPRPNDPNGDARTWSTGYTWCIPGNGDYSNNYSANNPAGSGSDSTTSKSTSSVLGVAMSPIATTYLNQGTLGPGGTGYALTDCWGTHATRSLIVGKFI